MNEDILEESIIRQIGEHLGSLMQRNADGGLELDVTRVRFMSSAVLRVLVRINKDVREFDGRMKLCNLDSSLPKVFEITRLTKVCDVS